MHFLRVPSRRPWQQFALICTCSLLFGACATAGSQGPAAAPNVAGLEAAAARNRNDLNAQVQLAAAYLQTGKSEESARLLEGVIALPRYPDDARYFLGLAYESLNRAGDARTQYAAYLQRNSRAPLRRTVRGRLAMLERRDLERAVQSALAQEGALAGTTPTPGVVGVFPFLNRANESLTPLSRALAELLTLDLSQTSRVRVVERAQVQRLLDEIQLGQSGSVDPATAVRAGRLLGAGKIVQGLLDGTESALRIQALVVPVPAPSAPVAPLTQQGVLRELLVLQNNLALDVYRSLGVELTVAERERVMRQPTQNVQALLAFGFALAAEDAGRYAEAAAQYRRAAALDPNFTEAKAALERADAKAGAADDTPENLVLEGVRAFSGGPAAVVVESRFEALEALIPNPGRRDPVAEVLGTETLDRRAFLNLLIRRPR